MTCHPIVVFGSEEMNIKLFRKDGMYVSSNHYAYYLLSLLLVISHYSCKFEDDDVEGVYYHKDLGSSYSLELHNGKFTQKLIQDNDTFINNGEYTLYNTVSVYNWKERSELINSNGGCYGCELMYRNKELLYYTDPDDIAIDVFIKD
ncbi:hypothetical protein CAP35_14700 [Chitinophagaceae bacterium IBVUCB1]|nr:hypothetical protein CAP35_14700 [Chitinophagaceae bacterium IBVUCB1]